MVRIPMYWRAFVLRTTEYRMFLVASKKKVKQVFRAHSTKGKKDKRTRGQMGKKTD